jgi:excisionase family DNA binding protein
METITFEQLPQAVSSLHEKLDKIEKLLLQNEHAEEKDELLNIVQAAQFLNLTTATIYGKVCRKEIPVNKQGKRLYFYKSELAEWIKSGRQRTSAELQQEAKQYLSLKRVRTQR